MIFGHLWHIFAHDAYAIRIWIARTCFGLQCQSDISCTCVVPNQLSPLPAYQAICDIRFLRQKILVNFNGVTLNHRQCAKTG